MCFSSEQPEPQGCPVSEKRYTYKEQRAQSAIFSAMS